MPLVALDFFILAIHKNNCVMNPQLLFHNLESLCRANDPGSSLPHHSHRR